MIHIVNEPQTGDILLMQACYCNTRATASVAQSDSRTTGDQEVAGSILAGSGTILTWRHHEILSTVILSFLLIQEGQQFLAKECAPILVNRLDD